MAHREKNIETALPLEAINKVGEREKSIRHIYSITLRQRTRQPFVAAHAAGFAEVRAKYITYNFKSVKSRIGKL